MRAAEVRHHQRDRNQRGCWVLVRQTGIAVVLALVAGEAVPAVVKQLRELVRKLLRELRT